MSNASVVTAATGFQQTQVAANNSRGVSALLYSCQQGDVEKVRRILRAQPYAYLETDRTGKNALHYCCISDRISAAQAADVLVMAAPDLIETRDEDGFTPLHMAVIAGNMPLVTFLLANNADVNAVDNENHTVVHWATVCGETVALRAVLAAGAPVSTPDVHDGYPLHYAAQMCGGEKDSVLGLQVLHTLLSHEDISVSVEDGDRRQPLLWAASAGSAKAVLALIRAGATVESHDKDGLTALHCSASRGHTDCIDTLLTLCGASPDVIDSNGCTALHYAVTLGHADATALLLVHGADPNRQDRKGRSPAHCGCSKGQFETVKMLGNRGANLWLRNARGDLPLHEAAASGRRDLVRWLLEARPSQVNARNNDGRCPLHLAALNDNADMCKILLDAGAQINPILRTSKNVFMTPLDCALQRGFRSTAKYLQVHGGVPANRLAGIPQQPQAFGSGVSLHIRDDVTFWGDSSSDTEKDAQEKSKPKKKSYKRKLAYKYEKKKGPVLLSEYDSEKLSSSKLESEPIKQKQTPIEINNQVIAGLPFVGANIPPGEIFIYANEVNINDRFGELRVNQKSDTLVSDSQVADNLKHINELQVQPTSSIKGSASVASDKRPKSAKYSRIKNTSDPQQDKYANTTRKVDTPDLRKKITHDEQGQDLLEHTTDEPKTQVKNFGQQSPRSNTSQEEGEDHQQFIVEASVHVPPKELIKKDGNSKQSLQTLETKNDQKEISQISASNLEKVEVASDKSEAAKLDKSNSELSQPKLEVSGVIAVTTTIVQEGLTNTAEEATKVEDKTETGVGSQSVKTEVTSDITQITSPDNTVKIDETTKANIEVQFDTPTVTTSIYPDDSAKEGAQTETGLDLINNNNLSERSARIAINIEEPSSPSPAPSTEQETVTSDVSRDSINQSENLTHAVKGNSQTELPDPKAFKDSTQPNKQESGAEIVKISEQAKTDNRTIENKCEKFIKTNKLKQTSSDNKTNNLPESSIDANSSEESELETRNSSSPSSISTTIKKHKSFKVLHENEKVVQARQKTASKKHRSKSEDKKRVRTADQGGFKEHDRLRRSKIPTPVMNLKTSLSKSDKHLDRSVNSSVEPRVPSLPDIHYTRDGHLKQTRSVSNLSAPLTGLNYSDNDQETGSEEERSAAKKKRLRKRSRTAKSARSDYESSNLIDSGFEPSPRSTRIPKWKNMSERGVNMTSVTQTIQSNIRRYHLERKIFQHLLDLKRLQIRSGQHNEAVLVKRAIDAYHKTCAATVGAGRYVAEDYTFKGFEHFLYNSLRKIQRNGVEHLHGLPEAPRNPLHCTQKTHRCDHATHAYTGVPCAAYLPKMDHHSLPKIGFECKPSGFLPKINSKNNTVTLELCHGNDKQVISLPAERLDQNKRYYVTFTVKGNDNVSTIPNEEALLGHQHSKSD